MHEIIANVIRNITLSPIIILVLPFEYINNESHKSHMTIDSIVKVVYFDSFGDLPPPLKLMYY